MANNHYNGSHKPPRAAHSHAKPNKGFPVIFKLLFLAACLLILAAYIGNRKPANDNIETAQAPIVDDRETIDPAPVILKPGSNANPPSANVSDASFSVSADGQTVYINGGIGKGFFDDLSRTLEANRFVQRVVITSGGGYAGPGLDAAQLIRKKNLTVRVKSHCASMCVGLWAAAAAREMEPDAVIGLHQWRATCDSLPEAERRECNYQSQFWAAHDISYDGWLRSAGFSDRLMQLQATTAASDVAALIAPQLWEEGVDFRVVDAEGNYMSRDATLSFLKAKYSRKNRS